MDSQDIAQLAAWLAETDLSSLTLEGPGAQLTLHRPGSLPPAGTPATPDPAAALAAPAPGSSLRAPCAGVFLSTHPLRSQPLVQVGDTIRPGQTVGLLQVDALLTPVRASTAGRVTAVHAQPGHIVGYGSPLFDLSPTD